VGLLKYKGRVRLAGPLCHYLFNSFQQYFKDIDLVVPVPLHPSRAWERQFNQAVLLVRQFSRRFQNQYGRAPDWQIRPQVLSRCRPTISQTGLDQKAREKNMHQAFVVKDPGRVKGKQILLIDDVYTSGATCRAAASCLITAGARQVDVLVLARA
jgi:ComF family protein